MGEFWEYVLIVALGLELAVLPHSIKEFEVLRKSNLELQLKLQHRIVTKDQRDKFITFLKMLPREKLLSLRFLLKTRQLPTVG